MARPAAVLGLLAAWLAAAAADPDWVALFLSPAEQEALCAKLLVPGVPSAAEPHCQHLTIAYNPPNMPIYAPHFGQRVRIQPLAVGRDTHGQALLCRVANSSLRSDNSFPHITISDAGAPPYTAVYSNTLWTRLSKPFGPCAVSRGLDGCPANVSLAGPAAWRGLLDMVTLENTTYAATEAHVHLLPGFSALTGTVCAASRWNATRGTCDVVPAAL